MVLNFEDGKQIDVSDIDLEIKIRSGRNELKDLLSIEKAIVASVNEHSVLQLLTAEEELNFKRGPDSKSLATIRVLYQIVPNDDPF